MVELVQLQVTTLNFARRPDSIQSNHHLAGFFTPAPLRFFVPIDSVAATLFPFETCMVVSWRRGVVAIFLGGGSSLFVGARVAVEVQV